MARAPKPNWLSIEPRTQTEAMRGLSVEARHIYLELMVAPERLLPWVLALGPAALAEQVGMPPEQALAALRELEARGLVVRDEARRFVYLPVLLRQASSGPPNPNSAAWLGRELAKLPPCELLERVDSDLRELLMSAGKDGLLAAYLHGKGERPALREVPLPQQPELPFPSPPRKPVALELVMEQQPKKPRTTTSKKEPSPCEGLAEAWRELAQRHPALGPIRPSGMTTTGLPQREERLLVACWKEAASAGYVFADLQMVAEWVDAGGLAWHGRPAWEWVAANIYKALLAAESWVQEGRPALRKAKAAQPKVAPGDDVLARMTAQGGRK